MEYGYEKKFIAKKGEEVYDIVKKAEEEVSKILNKNFEDVDATLNSKIRITINVTGGLR